MSKLIKIGITGINLLSPNRGVGALGISAIYILDKVAQLSDIKVEIYIIQFRQPKLQILDIGGKKIELKSIDPVSIFSPVSFLKTIFNSKDRRSLTDYLSLDYVFCIGEGDSFSDIYGKRRFDLINDQHKIARFFKKKYLLLPQTIGPFKDTKVKFEAIKSLQKAEKVFPRDRMSFEFVKTLTNKKENFETMDMAFFMPFSKNIFNQKVINVGLNISGLLWNGGYTKDNQFNLKSNYQELTLKIIKYFLSFNNICLHLVPHVVDMNNSVENDYQVSKEVLSKFDNDKFVLAPFFLSPLEAKDYISGLDFFIGARMHSAIAAFSSGVPVFPLAYSRKFNGLFGQTLNYQYFGDLVNCETEEVFQSLIDTFERRDEVKDHIVLSISNIIDVRRKLIYDQLGSVLASLK